MSRGVQQSFFLGLPDRNKLCSVTLSLQEAEEPRTKQIKTCRELVLLYSDILASPALDSFTDITVVMAIPFFQRGILQLFGQRHSLQLGSPQCVFPGVLQCCLSYSLITRLAPSWNKAGLFLIAGKDFLTESGKLHAVSMELSTTEGQLCVGIEASSVRLPPTRLEDFELPPLVLRRFCSDPESVLDPSSTGGALWCHVLPSMKKGQIITISRQLPRDGPFRTYRDLQNHWISMYGYRLPELAEEDVVYCSIYFRLVGEKLFTYPLSCVRLQPVQRCRRADLQGALGRFLSEVRVELQNVCGFPARLSCKPHQHTAGPSSAATVMREEQFSWTSSSSSSSSSSSIWPGLTPLPPPPAVEPCSGSWAPLSQQDRAQRPSSSSSSSSSSSGTSFSFAFSSGYLSAPSLTSSSALPLSQPASTLTSSPSSLLVVQPASTLTSSSSSSSSSCSSSGTSFSFVVSSGYLSAPSLSSSSSSSSFPIFQPASSLSSSSSSSSALPPLPPAVLPAPKLVPIFRNKCPSRQVNVALLRVQRQREHLGGGGGEEKRGRVTLPIFREAPPTSAPSSLSAVSLPPPPPKIVPRFSRQPGPPQPAGPSRVLSLSPTSSRSRPRLLLSPASSRSRPRLLFSPASSKSRPRLLLTSRLESSPKTGCEGSAPRPPTPPEASRRKSASCSRGGVVFESKLKKSRSAVRDMDVEQMARNNQLSRLNSATLLAWLRGRGALVSAKHKKEELMLKVMGCLAEA